MEFFCCSVMIIVWIIISTSVLGSFISEKIESLNAELVKIRVMIEELKTKGK